jgi:hypothetical protein
MAALDQKEGEEEDTRTAAMPSGVGDTEAADPLAHILVRGAEFLTNLGRALAESTAPPHEVMEKEMQAIIGKDETTGKTYLKIPLPKPETVQTIFSALGGLLAGVLTKRQG